MAGKIPPAFINELLARTDIANVIGKYVPLKKRGREYVACCPFHNEKTPSFTVSPEKQFFHCFGCGENGSAIGFLMKHQRLSFPEAAEILARDAGLEVPREAGAKGEFDKHKKLFTVLEQTANLYRKYLKEGAQAKAYLRERGIDAAVADAFMLGFAPRAYGHLKQAFNTAYDEKLLLAAGVLSRSEKGDVYERFRERVIFPIRDRGGRVIAFGGRVLPGGDAPAKYLNSPETPVFQKRNVLYGVYELRQAGKYDRIIVVEGYMDVVSLAQHGARNVLATLGTACTRSHIQGILRIVPHVVFCFDSDLAGRKAAARAMEQSLPLATDERRIDFLFLPQGHDPDSFVREHGKEAFDAAAREATSLADFMFEYCGAGDEGARGDDIAANTQMANKLKPLLAQLPPGVFREQMYAKLAGRLGIAVERLRPQMASATGVPSRPLAVKYKKTGGARTRPGYSTVKTAIALLLNDPQLAESVADAERFARLEGTALLIDILRQIRQHGLTTGGSVVEMYREHEHGGSLCRLAAEFPASADARVRRSEFVDAIKQIDKRILDKQIEELIADQRVSGASADKQARLKELLEEKRKLSADA